MSSALTIDVDRCVACGRCEIACAVEHSHSRELAGAIGQRDTLRARISVVEHRGAPAVLVCIHCDDPACAAVCPAGAITKQPSGEVVLAEELCVGCGACAVACHLGVPAARADGRAYVTCDLCPSRRAESRTTACAEACPTGAITFGEGKAGQGLVGYLRPAEDETVYMKFAGVGSFRGGTGD